MRAMLFAMSAVAVIGFAGSSSLSATPFGGVAVGNAANAGLVTEEVDCRRYPHRHKNARPHGWGFGCPKKKAPTPKRKAPRKTN